MNSFPKTLHKFMPNLVHILAIPACFLVSVFLYEPSSLSALMRAGEGLSRLRDVATFNAAMVFVILLGCMTVARLPFYFLRKRLGMTLLRYLFWCVFEILLCCAFSALFLVLMSRKDGSWFLWFGRCISAIGSSLLVPYAVLTPLYGWLDVSENSPLDDDVRLKFYDSRHQLKFITEASSILYIESAENYIIIHYLDNGIEKRFQLRNSMKNIEPLCEKAGFARTHRCFIINPRHIKTIRRDPGGQNFADLGCERSEGIPISKKYHGSIVSIF